jgi:hypothetical protein
LAQAGIEKPDFVFVFAAVGYNQQVLVRSIREATAGAPLSGCSGEGIITQETITESNFGVAVMVVRSDELRFEHACVKEINRKGYDAGERVAASIKPFLAADNIACFILADGLVFNFDSFLETFEKKLGQKQPLSIFGGLAADNLEVRKTYQYHNDEVFSEGISYVVLSGKGSIAWGINHDCVPVGTKRTITRSAGNTIYEIDGIPALEALKDYFEEDWMSQWNKTVLNVCLGFRASDCIKQDYGEYIIRYMMGKDDQEGSVKIQSNVHDGTEFWIARRDNDLIKGGMQALGGQIKDMLGTSKPKFILHFECVGRGKVILREHEKIELIKFLQSEIGGDIPWIGFYTYGEIGPVSGYNCFHNFTAVVTAVY